MEHPTPGPAPTQPTAPADATQANADATQTNADAGLYWALIGMLLATAIGPVIWWGCYVWFAYAYVAALLIGLLIGLGARVMPGRAPGWVAGLAAVFTVLATAMGFLYLDQFVIPWAVNNQPVQPTLGDSMGRMFRDLWWVLWTALGAYTAFALSRPGR